MKIKVNIENDFSSSGYSELLTRKFKSPDDGLDIEIYIGNNPISYNHVKSVEDGLNYIMGIKDKFSGFISDAQANSVEPIMSISIIYNNEKSINTCLDNVENSDYNIFNLKIINPNNFESVAAFLSKVETIKTLCFLKKIYIDSKKIFETIWESPKKFNYKMDEPIYGRTMYINSSLDVSNSTDLIATILNKKDEDFYENIVLECDTYEESSPYFYRNDNEDYSISFRSYNDAIKWILYANVEYTKFKNDISGWLMIENFSNEISLFLLRYI